MLVSLPDNVDRVAFVECKRYDEATNLMAVRQSSDFALAGDGLRTKEDVITARFADWLENDDVVESVPAKLFQTESGWGALLAVCEDDRTKYVFVINENVSTGQVLQRTTPECIAQAIVLNSTCRIPTTARFGFKMRLICSDRYSAQLAAEIGVATVSPAWGNSICLVKCTRTTAH